jgi:hypothetical protein
MAVIITNIGMFSLRAFISSAFWIVKLFLIDYLFAIITYIRSVGSNCLPIELFCLRSSYTKIKFDICR